MLSNYQSSIFSKVLVMLLIYGIGAPHHVIAQEKSSASDTSIKETPINIRSPSRKQFFKQNQQFFPETFQLTPQQPTSEDFRSTGQVPDDYPVGPGDQFLINFWGKIEDNLIISIDSEKKLFLPRIGFIDTSGMIYKDLLIAIDKKISSSMRGIKFTVSLYKSRLFTVYVLGAVEVPGPYRVQASSRASEVIHMAGGPLSTGSKQYIQIRRKIDDTTKVLPVNLLSYASFADFTRNPYVTDGDVIFIPILKEFVAVTGAVVAPGTFEIQEVNTLSGVIQALGGLSIYADKKSPIKLSRLQADGGRKVMLIDRDRDSEFELKHGDELFVPSSRILIPSKGTSVFVTGQVFAPGPKPYRISTSLEEYVGLAGGLTDRANFADALIYKTDGTKVPVTERMNIEPGDTIFVPEATFKFWQDHLAIITTFISLATSIIVLSSRID